MRSALAALACLFLAAHLPFLPPNLEDIDSVNFALGVRDFDVARHQPHPPGYPVYVALAKASTATLGGPGNPRAVVSGLAAWSALAGAALVVLLFELFRRLEGRDTDAGATRRAWWGMGIAVASPLFWFTALRPLSDMTGLAAAVASQVLLLSSIAGSPSRRPGMALLAGAFLAAVSAGIRVQTVLLTGPLLVAALGWPSPWLALRTRLAAVGAMFAGVAVWAGPLLGASGGFDGYLAALGTQAGEDFGGVAMLWTSRRASVAAHALIYSFLWPWGGLILGGVVMAVAAMGALRLLIGNPRTPLWLALGFGPYAAFHLLFHETVTIRYALPLVIPTAYLTSCGLDWLGRRPAAILSAALIIVSLGAGARAARDYGSVEAPSFRAMNGVREAAGDGPIGMHAVFRRTAEWSPPGSNLLRAPHGQEWLAMVERWKAEPASSVAFVSDPRRTDLALFDPRARERKGSHRWPFPELPYVGGVRPGSADWYVMRPPGWMLDRGWALSAEIGGVASRDAAGPHLRPSIAWVRARPEPALLMIGGRNLGGGGTAQFTLSGGESVIDSWDVPPGFFFRLMPMAGGVLAGQGYVPLSVTASSAGNAARASLEQFDLQPDGVAMFGFMEGWQEPEYNPATARSWRWMSEEAVVWVRPVGRDVTLTLSGESPLRYFDSAPNVRLTLAGQELARFELTADFTREVRLPAALLEAAAGKLVIQSSQWFSPADREGSADRRHLALRIYEVAVR